MIKSIWNWFLSLIGNNTTTTTTTRLPFYTPTTTSTTTTILGGKRMKKSLHFSINDYPGIQNDLRGCNNDSLNWANLLRDQYGFETKRIIDSACTRANIINEMNNLIANSRAGDVLAFTYSGHGTSVVDKDSDEIDGKDEAICLYDGNLLDDEIRIILNKLPEGVKLTFVSDSCFSGTVTRAFLSTMNDFSYISVPKYLPPFDIIDAIRLDGMPSLRGFAFPEDGMNHILISGCSDKEYSYDANIGGFPTGAFSYYAIQILKNCPKITYKDFYKKLKEVLPCSKYPQSPQLEGNDTNKNSIMFE